MFKTVLLIIVFLIPCFIGVKLAGCIRARHKQIECICLIISETQTQIEYGAVPLKDIIKALSQDKRFSSLIPSGFSEYDHDCAERFSDHIISSQMCCLKSEEKTMLKDFFNNIGKTDIDGQTEHCELYMRKFKILLEDPDNAEQKKMKALPSLGIFIGAFLVIMFI